MKNIILILLFSSSGFTAMTQSNNNHPGLILWTADWSSDDRYIAVGGNDNTLRIYDGTTYRLIKKYPLDASVQCIKWNMDNNRIAIALDDNPVHILNFQTGKFVLLDSTGAGSRALDWNNDGSMLAIGDYDGMLWIYDSLGKVKRIIHKEDGKTYLSVDWHPYLDQIATASDKIRIFDADGKLLLTRKHREEETILLTIQWHPEGKLFATGDYGHDTIESLLQLWNADGTLIRSVKGSQAEYRNIRWNKTGDKLASTSDVLRIWSPDGDMLNSGMSSDLLWGLSWNNKNQLITTAKKGKITIWSDDANQKLEITE